MIKNWQDVIDVDFPRPGPVTWQSLSRAYKQVLLMRGYTFFKMCQIYDRSRNC